MKMKKSGIFSVRTRGRNKLVFLFLIAVVLPSAVLIALTWQMIGQERELGQKRQADERTRMARELGQKLLVRLEEIKLHEMSAAASGAQFLNILKYTSREVILIGLADRERLLLPWESDPVNDRLNSISTNTSFVEKIRRAEDEEFIRGQLTRANTLYLKCIEESQDPDEQVYLRLQRARVLSKLDKVDESLM